ncbi:5-deoxy-glucuronate isomerase [Virgibacillus halotolerans]|nr:5-deoxy-glucuronate isomerase [Virgibacillus halotolerans]
MVIVLLSVKVIIQLCAAGGYKLYYLWFLAGPSYRLLSPKDEPNHKWLKS